MNNASILLSLNVLAAVLLVMMALVTMVQLLAKLGEQWGRGDQDDAIHGETTPELIAVLTAAASEALGTSVCLHRIHVHRDAAHPRWARAGRMDIMYSHRLEPRR
jgi:hypothetical protein